MAGQKDYNYTNNDAPYSSLLTREGNLTYQFGGRDAPGARGSGSDDGTTQTRGGSVATVALKSEGNATDVWIQNFVRSVNWKPKAVGFYIDGGSGYAEFANVYISGTIVVATGSIGGFVIGSDYIRDNLNTMGMASTVSGIDDVRFWAGSTFANRLTAPFRVLESGKVIASNVEITGGVIDGGTIEPGTVTYTELAYPPLNGLVAPTVTPGALGQIYINTALGHIFMAIGTTDANDWAFIPSYRLARELSVFDAITVTDVPTIAIKSAGSVFDLITVTEAVTIQVNTFISTSDLVTITENTSLAVI